MRDPLRYTFDDARRQLLLDDIAMSTADKIAWFEEMVELVIAVGAVGRLAGKRGADSVDDLMPDDEMSADPGRRCVGS